MKLCKTYEKLTTTLQISYETSSDSAADELANAPVSIASGSTDEGSLGW